MLQHVKQVDIVMVWVFCHLLPVLLCSDALLSLSTSCSPVLFASCVPVLLLLLLLPLLPPSASPPPPPLLRHGVATQRNVKLPHICGLQKRTVGTFILCCLPAQRLIRSPAGKTNTESFKLQFYFSLLV